MDASDDRPRLAAWFERGRAEGRRYLLVWQDPFDLQDSDLGLFSTFADGPEEIRRELGSRRQGGDRLLEILDLRRDLGEQMRGAPVLRVADLPSVGTASPVPGGSWLVGYGTLLSRVSAERTLGGSFGGRRRVPVLVDGYRRLFNLRPDHYEPSFRLSKEPIEVAALNVQRARGFHFNGLAFAVTAEDLRALDRREAGYERVRVAIRPFGTTPGGEKREPGRARPGRARPGETRPEAGTSERARDAEGARDAEEAQDAEGAQDAEEAPSEAFLYSAPPGASRLCADPARLLPCWRDVVLAREGAWAVGTAFGRTFDRTTYLADGRTLLVEAYREHLPDPREGRDTGTRV